MLSLNSSGSGPSNSSNRPAGLSRISSGGQASRALLAAAVGTRQQETREGELQRKLGRLSLPSVTQIVQEKTTKSKQKNSTASRRTSTVT